MSEEKKEATGVNNPDWNPKDNTGTKKTRKPRNFDNILSGAKSLPLKERVDMINALRETVTAELETIKAAAADAEKTVNGLG